MHGFRQYNTTLIWERQHETVAIEPWGRDSLRVRASVNGDIHDPVVNVLLPAEATEVQITLGEDEATLVNGNITAQVSAVGGIRFLNTQSGAEILAEKKPFHSSRIPARFFKSKHSDLHHLEARFCAYSDERLYGLGQHQHGLLDQKGATIDLIQRNSEVSIPFLFSSRGYGFLWHNPAIGRVELGTNETRWVAEATPQLDYWITVGDSPAEIMERYADATGHAPEFPDWATGFWQSKLRYRNQDELLSVAREYKRRGLPLSVIVIDFFHWSLQGDWRFDPQAWPDPAAMVQELKELGIELMVSIWPTVNPLSENFATMLERGLLLRTERGIPFLMSFQDNRPEGQIGVYYYDSSNPEARDFIWEQVNEHYYQLGIKTWWLDACEPEMFPLDPDNVRFHIGNGQAVANAYPLLHERGFYEHIKEAGAPAVVNLCRSGWAGSQRYASAIWSGDINSTFETLQAQIRAGLNMALSGIPWWTTDIGGFYGADINSAYFRELVVRWFQYGVFCPLFRLHGYRMESESAEQMLDSGAENEAWSFGDEAYGIITDLLFLRERLRPYINEQMRIAHEKGLPPMRPLFFDFPEDAACAAIEDQFLFGSDLLVAPVLFEGARSREVYLPAGTTWTDAWSGESYAGGQRITAAAPLERIPVYLRADAQLPIRNA
ncbi:glycoside hydrolase family 31 protein [Dictyobacter arantiisoli]|uniref:Family 31 glucosidase n=1 Tax=Dictyobacter arantiisoli TaxID=2014874 RepID=A0A5A5TC63_9CHLR|nr:glycoside hydrolase family 31 protein [Dictyobacter arantiisoli]GCF08917.1 family 31 glucosidase [Dictyobacter arantiisoli]